MNLAHTSGDVRAQAEGEGTDGTGWVGLSRMASVLCFIVVSRHGRWTWRAQRYEENASQVTCCCMDHVTVRYSVQVNPQVKRRVLS